MSAATATFDIIVSNSTGQFTLAPPSTGEITSGQGRVGAATGMGRQSGFREPPKSSFALYRRMRGNPTIAMARVAAFAPVKAASWSIVADSDAGVPDERVQFVEAQVLPLRARLLSDLAFALDYGFASWEKVWRVAPVNGRSSLVLDKLKSLKPELTRIEVLESTGAFAGLSQKGVKLSPSKSLLFTNDLENQDWYGRSRNENIRTEYAAWNDLLGDIGVLAKKVSGPIPIIKYPEGTGKDASGTTQSNADNAMSLLNALSHSIGVAMPNRLSAWAERAIQAGIDPKQLGAWVIEFLEPSSGHLGELMESMQHLEKLFSRGWLVPERAVSEAVLSGSRADSEDAMSLMFLIAEDLATQIDAMVSNYVINPIMTYNFGADTIDTVKLEHQPVTDDAKKLIAGIARAVLENPNNFDMLTKVLDFDAMLDRAELPRIADTADILDEMEPPGTAQAVADVTAALGEMQQKNQATQPGDSDDEDDDDPAEAA